MSSCASDGWGIALEARRNGGEVRGRDEQGGALNIILKLGSGVWRLFLVISHHVRMTGIRNLASAIWTDEDEDENENSRQQFNAS